MDNAPGPEAQPPAEPRCPSCAAAVAAGARFCPSCGAAQDRPRPEVDIAGWFRAGWNLFVNNIGVSIAVPLVVLVPVLVFATVSYLLFFVSMPLLGSGRPWTAAPLLGFIGVAGLLMALVMPPLQAGICACFLEGMRRGAVTADRLGVGFRRWWSCLWVFALLVAGMAAAAPFTVVLVGIPVIIGLQTLLWLSLFHIVDRGEGGAAALRFASRVMQGRLWMLLLFTLLVFLLINAGFSVVWLGVLVTTPIAIAALAAAYEDLRRRAGPGADLEAEGGAVT